MHGLLGLGGDDRIDRYRKLPSVGIDPGRVRFDAQPVPASLDFLQLILDRGAVGSGGIIHDGGRNLEYCFSGLAVVRRDGAARFIDLQRQALGLQQELIPIPALPRIYDNVFLDALSDNLIAQIRMRLYIPVAYIGNRIADAGLRRFLDRLFGIIRNRHGRLFDLQHGRREFVPHAGVFAADLLRLHIAPA